jgi:predicted DNA repair protein MutK
MAGASLLALLDDIATILDDVALMTKVAAKKTAGVLGDDLALNAQQVAGVRAERELPVVWAVGVGSLKNKLILVPAALAISALLPQAITPLLMLGGLYLCFEGVEKLAHKWLHAPAEDDAHHAEQLALLADPAADLVAMEKDKIKGAVRTDFVLSAEIIVIALGTVADKPFATQVAVLSGIGLLMTSACMAWSPPSSRWMTPAPGCSNAAGGCRRRWGAPCCWRRRS